MLVRVEWVGEGTTLRLINLWGGREYTGILICDNAGTVLPKVYNVLAAAVPIEVAAAAELEVPD